MASVAASDVAPIQTEVLVDGPFSAALLFWRARRGELRCSIIVKTTYALLPRLAPLVEPPDQLRTADLPWYGSRDKSIRTPSDLVPFKHSPEVMLVGHAYSPGKKPQRRLAVRLLVGDLDTALDVSAPRRFLPDGSLEEPLAARMPLAYEYASGGSDSDNPVGVDMGLVDAWGKRGAPSVLQLGAQISHPADSVEVAGWGPVAPSWPSRARRLRAEDRAWLADPAGTPMPAAFDVRFFQSAPHQHWLAGPIRPDERLVLENLSPSYERLVTNLERVVPYASVISSKELRVPLIADTLFIDTDRALVTMTWRGLVLVDERAPSLMVLVASTPGQGSMPPPADDRAAMLAEVETTRAETLPGGIPKMPLPFPMAAPNARSPSPDYDDDALPFRTPDADLSQTQARPAYRMTPVPPEPAAPPPPPAMIAAPEPPPPAAPSMHRAPEPPPPRPSFAATPVPAAPVAPTFGRPPGSSTPSPPSFGAPPAFGAAPEVSAPSPRSFGAALPPPPVRSGGASWAPPVEMKGRGVVVPAPPAEGVSEPAPAASGASGWMSLRSASDAAADRDTRGARPADRRSGDDRARDFEDGAAAPRRHAFVDLLAFEPALPARLRRTPALSKLLAWKGERPAWVRPDEPIDEGSREDRGRLDVLRVLSFGAPCDLPRVREMLDDAFDDATQLELPLVVVAGQLKPSHDDLALLRATVRAGQPLSLTNKPLQAALKVLEEAVETGVAPPGEATAALLRQAEQAAGAMWSYLSAQVQRMILDERQFKRRTVLGDLRIRAELTTPSGEAVPAYVPASVAPSLPMLASFPVVVIGELRPREDAQETHAEALLVWALGRVVRQVGGGGRAGR